MNLKDTIFIKALHGKNESGRPPLWFMRQAGRYMANYRALRDKYGFIEMMSTPELSCEITLQPINRFKMDAAILFSDILVTARALGSNLDYVEGKGPLIDNPVRQSSDVDCLDVAPTVEKLSYVFDSIKLLKAHPDLAQTPLIGFAGAPFTVAAYMVEGKSSQDLKTLKTMMASDPAPFHGLLKKLADCTVLYLNEQIKSGVDALQIFDTWAGLLSYQDLQHFSVDYIQDIVSRLDNPENIPVMVYARGSANFMSLAKTLPINGLSLDWQCDLKTMRQQAPDHFTLQGNLDPYLLFGSKNEVEKRVRTILDVMAGDPAFIFNLGHGILPKTDPEMIEHIVSLVKNY